MCSNVLGISTKEGIRTPIINIDEFDVKSSVPRVTYLLNKGEWLDNDIDLYACMFNNKRDFIDSKLRNFYKSIFMKLYFSRSKAEAIRNALKDFNSVKDEIKSLIGRAYDNMIDYIGNSYGSEIFLHESNIYILVREYIINKYNIDMCQVYDAFFLPEGLFTRREMNDIIKSCAYDYLNNYLGKSKDH